MSRASAVVDGEVDGSTLLPIVGGAAWDQKSHPAQRFPAGGDALQVAPDLHLCGLPNPLE